MTLLLHRFVIVGTCFVGFLEVFPLVGLLLVHPLLWIVCSQYTRLSLLLWQAPFDCPIPIVKDPHSLIRVSGVDSPWDSLLDPLLARPLSHCCLDAPFYTGIRVVIIRQTKSLGLVTCRTTPLVCSMKNRVSLCYFQSNMRIVGVTE